MNHKNIKVTTTSGFDNAEIEQYLEPVTAHLAVGMNFFKDFLSGFSDFFGGKSRSYQKTLESLNSEAINQLKIKASTLGANCVVGLKIDNDEISAQGKSMLMVTVIGTAAKAKFKELDLQTNSSTTVLITKDQFKVVEKKLYYLAEGKEGRLEFNEEFWEFAKKYQILEMADLILGKYEKDLKNFVTESFEREVAEYFSSIEPVEAKGKIYSLLAELETSQKLKKKLVDLIKKLNFLEYESLIQLLESTDFETQKIALSLLDSDKELYENKDVELQNKIIALLPSKFPDRGTISTKKKMLSSKEKEIWVCECSKENDVATTYCSNCQRNMKGFRYQEFSPERSEE
ncbi:MAG: YbjQ family protein, partial [Cyclobacteriaceae bacterium]